MPSPQDLGVEQLQDYDILMKVQLPPFLMTHEDYMQMEMPPVKNFVINQKELSQKETHFTDSEQVQARDSEV